MSTDIWYVCENKHTKNYSFWWQRLIESLIHEKPQAISKLDPFFMKTWNNSSLKNQNYWFDCFSISLIAFNSTQVLFQFGIRFNGDVISFLFIIFTNLRKTCIHFLKTERLDLFKPIAHLFQKFIEFTTVAVHQHDKPVGKEIERHAVLFVTKCKSSENAYIFATRFLCNICPSFKRQFNSSSKSGFYFWKAMHMSFSVKTLTFWKFQS